MWDLFHTFWNGLSPLAQTIIATLLTATASAAFLVWQISRQAQNAIRQNRHNEALKLKLKVYQEIVSTIREASDAESDLSTYIRLFLANTTVAANLHRQHLPFQTPQFRVPDLIKKKGVATTKLIELIFIIERWNIIDRKMPLFQTAFNVANHDVNEAYDSFFDFVLPLGPFEAPSGPHQGQVLPWSPLSQQTIDQLQILAENLLNALSLQSSYIHDFQVEMQNLLLSELFENKVAPREPIDPRYRAVRFDQFDELAKFFDSETTWGRHKTAIETEVREKINAKPQQAQPGDA